MCFPTHIIFVFLFFLSLYYVLSIMFSEFRFIASGLQGFLTFSTLTWKDKEEKWTPFWPSTGAQVKI